MILLGELAEKRYDKLLILDSDAMLSDFSRDIVSLLPSDKVLVGHKVHRNDTNSTSNINIGVTLWNLRHPATEKIALRWKQNCLDFIQKQSNMRDSDQCPLQKHLEYELLMRKREELVLAISEELGYSRGKFAKHFIQNRLDRDRD